MEIAIPDEQLPPTDTVTIRRVRVIEYETQEIITLTADDYQAVLTSLGVDSLDNLAPEQMNNAIENIVGDEWEAEWTEPCEDKVHRLWVFE